MEEGGLLSFDFLFGGGGGGGDDDGDDGHGYCVVPRYPAAATAASPHVLPNWFGCR